MPRQSMILVRRFFTICVIGVSCAIGVSFASAAAPPAQRGSTASDAAAAQDFPGLPRFRNSTLVGYQAVAFDSFRLPTGPATRDATSTWQVADALPLEGKVTGYVYVLPPGTASLEVFRNYQNALSSAGFTTLFACDDDDACGDGDVLAQKVYSGSQSLLHKSEDAGFSAASRRHQAGWM